jgi:phage terminase large subunit-like protein
VGGQWAWQKIKEMIVLTALMDGPYVPIHIEQEPGAGGKNQVAEIASFPELKEYSVRPHRPEGDKIMRANTWFAEASRGCFTIVNGPWNQIAVSAF